MSNDLRRYGTSFLNRITGSQRLLTFLIKLALRARSHRLLICITGSRFADFDNETGSLIRLYKSWSFDGSIRTI
jgi:hypothetical protein